jgi:hypothetical protein
MLFINEDAIVCSIAAVVLYFFLYFCTIIIDDAGINTSINVYSNDVIAVDDNKHDCTCDKLS